MDMQTKLNIYIYILDFLLFLKYPSDKVKVRSHLFVTRTQTTHYNDYEIQKTLSRDINNVNHYKKTIKIYN